MSPGVQQMDVQPQLHVQTGNQTDEITPKAKPREYPVQPGPSGSWQWQEDRVPLEVEVCLDPSSTGELQPLIEPGEPV